jgi:alkylation response protein AidB-like acyl-CoA dehydrogenase
MTYKLQAHTQEGRELVAMAERHAEDFATRAAAHDREGTFPFENIEALKASGYLYAPVPKEYGGLGVESVHDTFVATSRLAEGDPSITLGSNMHVTTLMTLARVWRIAVRRENAVRASVLGATMRGIVDSGAVIGAAVSEPDQDLTRQNTTAHRDADGWILNGRKIFSSMAPAATHFGTTMDYIDDEGVERYAFAIVPRDTPGVTVNDDWDAMGMRASGSVSVAFDNVRFAGPGRGAPAGVLSAEFLDDYITSGAAHASASIGIAESTQALAVGAVQAKVAKKGEGWVRPTVRHLAAENAIDLSAMRAIFGRALESVDRYYAEHPVSRGTLDETHAVYAEVQHAKAFVNAASVRIVDRALTIAGGAGYANGHPLSRLYRDARAGAFMHPLGANIAYEYIGGVALGMPPEKL